MDDLEESISEEQAEGLDFVIRTGVRALLKHPDPQRFIAWFNDAVPRFAPFLVEQAPDEAAKRSFLATMARMIWNRTPLPENYFRARPLPKPERNSACYCGSGQKYKRCCAGIEELPDPFEAFSMLKYVLEEWPSARFAELPFSYLDIDELAFVAHSWLDEGQAELAVKLLEPLFNDLQPLDERAELAFDALADAYDELERPRKKQALLRRLQSAPNKTLRSAAMHRQITITADSGDYDGAWKLFEEAQRLEPNNPSLAPLELTLLLAQGEREKMRQRGQFWITRLARERDQDYSELIAMLRRLMDSPDEPYLQLSADATLELNDLKVLVQALPAPECHYELEGDASMSKLDPRAELAKVEQKWQRLTQVPKPGLVSLQTDAEFMWDAPQPWLDFLRETPLAWQSFEVLDDVLLALGSTIGGMGVANVLAKPLAQHAVALLRQVLEKNGAQGRELPWAILDNRPALRLVAHLIHLLDEGREQAAATELMEWMVLTLNPNDNHGFRDELAGRYLAQERAQAAFELCERYPEDAGTLQFDRALALYLLDRKDEAADALREARKYLPEIYRMLQQEDPKQPRIDPHWITHGGKDEAWLYRQQRGPLWRQSGALAWAKSALAGKRSAAARQNTLPLGE